ncbi:MAG TPA: tyrosine-type recombinase/integrase [Candidatus Aquilonibacter sp.]|nr:tyrosine-type recombinase/integrase [Candidatus Aquilonibacter sp.]
MRFPKQQCQRAHAHQHCDHLKKYCRGSLRKGLQISFAVQSTFIICEDSPSVDLYFHIERLKGSLDSVQALLRVQGNPLRNEPTVLKAWLDVRKPDADNLVFNSQKSTQLNQISVYKLFKAIARKAGLPEMPQHPQVLKHTCIMRMAQEVQTPF